jgi:uncharacterized protein
MIPGLVLFPGKALVHVAIVDRPEEQAKGLSGRTELDETDGMLFWFGTRRDHGFWMKRTLIPLDVLFLDFDRVVGMTTLQPLDERVYKCGALSSAVLEVNAGWAARHEVRLGDSVQIRLT